jgi:hypothetical protein
MRPHTEKSRLLLAPLFIAAFAGIGFITMFLWNSLMPYLFQLPLISFWQALGLLILSRLLFGFNTHWGHRDAHDRAQLREKMKNMDPQEREEFRKRWNQHRPSWTDRFNNQSHQDTSETKQY